MRDLNSGCLRYKYQKCRLSYNAIGSCLDSVNNEITAFGGGDPHQHNYWVWYMNPILVSTISTYFYLQMIHESNFSQYIIVAFVGNYAEIIPRRAFPNSFDMFDGHTGKCYSGPCNGMGQPHSLVNTLRY